MDALKWLLNASLLIAFMFLGMKAQPQEEETDNSKPQKSVIVRLLG
jgi:hypothetical protein